MIYTPDRWMIIKTPKCYKVFATWFGSYLNGPTWKSNSGIKKVEIVGDYYLFHGYSGSIYECRKDLYGITTYGQEVLNGFIEIAEGEVQILKDVSEMEI